LLLLSANYYRCSCCFLLVNSIALAAAICWSKNSVTLAAAICWSIALLLLQYLLRLRGFLLLLLSAGQ
jgi:hypothetical protein